MSHSRKHSDELLKWWKCQNQEYWVTTKGVIWESTQVSYQNDKRHCQKTVTVRLMNDWLMSWGMKTKSQAHNLLNKKTSSCWYYNLYKMTVLF